MKRHKKKDLCTWYCAYPSLPPSKTPNNKCLLDNAEASRPYFNPTIIAKTRREGTCTVHSLVRKAIKKALQKMQELETNASLVSYVVKVSMRRTKRASPTNL